MKISASVLAVLAVPRPSPPCGRGRRDDCVPADAPTIQQAMTPRPPAIRARLAGHLRRADQLRGKAITVAAEQGPKVTILDGNRAGSVVTFSSGETRGGVDRLHGPERRQQLQRRRRAHSYSSPSIIGNRIVNNGACSGAGVYSYFSSPLIKGNTISRNYVYACSGASGLGVYVGGDSAAELLDNVITENSGFANGGGVTLFAAGRAVLAAT